ncbi:MAG: NUDIX domain-containing protein, partial [Actinobacteria bacterium]|nr:NUDIX domain-containing protein [Actinomycetota bacterium]
RKDSSPGFWDVACSGHVDGEETYAEAAVRELGEELGYHGPPPEHLGTLLTELDDETEMAGVFRLRADGPFGLMLPEVIGLGIFSADDWPTPLTPSAQLVINFALGSDPYAKSVVMPSRSVGDQLCFGVRPLCKVGRFCQVGRLGQLCIGV